MISYVSISYENAAHDDIHLQIWNKFFALSSEMSNSSLEIIKQYWALGKIDLTLPATDIAAIYRKWEKS